jgi:hypothetical protein
MVQDLPVLGKTAAIRSKAVSASGDSDDTVADALRRARTRCPVVRPGRVTTARFPTILQDPRSDSTAARFCALDRRSQHIFHRCATDLRQLTGARCRDRAAIPTRIGK